MGSSRILSWTGWHLSRIDRSGAYKLKGYSSITEYARETFGMTPDGVSRFIHVYEKYSIQGDTPELREEYRDFNFSQLTEMLQLPEEGLCHDSAGNKA